MRPSCAASSAYFAHSISPQPSFFIWQNINFTSFFLPSLCILSRFSSPVCIFLFLIGFSQFPPPANSTYKSRSAQSIQKATIPLLVTGQSQTGLCRLHKILFRTRASQFSNCKENPTECAESPILLCPQFPRTPVIMWNQICETHRG